MGFLTDLAAYDPYTAIFHLRRSQQSWATLHVRAFSSRFIPQISGTAEDRCGAIPLTGMVRPQLICSPACFWYPRKSFGLFFPNDGSWNIQWNPVTPSAIETCFWGWGFGEIDVPISGIDKNGDGYSDFVVHRAASFSDPATVWFKHSTPAAGCTGSTSSVSYPALPRTRVRAFAVSDMTGDGKAEIIFLDPDLLTVRWATSESGYTTMYVRDFANQRAIFL